MIMHLDLEFLESLQLPRTLPDPRLEPLTSLHFARLSHVTITRKIGAKPTPAQTSTDRSRQLNRSQQRSIHC